MTTQERDALRDLLQWHLMVSTHERFLIMFALMYEFGLREDFIAGFDLEGAPHLVAGRIIDRIEEYNKELLVTFAEKVKNTEIPEGLRPYKN